MSDSFVSSLWTLWSPPGSSVQGILQATMLEWVAMSSSTGIFSTQGSNPGLLWLLHCRQSLYRWVTGKTLSCIYFHLKLITVVSRWGCPAFYMLTVTYWLVIRKGACSHAHLCLTTTHRHPASLLPCALYTERQTAKLRPSPKFFCSSCQQRRIHF